MDKTNLIDISMPGRLAQAVYQRRCEFLIFWIDQIRIFDAEQQARSMAKPAKPSLVLAKAN